MVDSSIQKEIMIRDIDDDSLKNVNIELMKFDEYDVPIKHLEITKMENFRMEIMAIVCVSMKNSP